MKKVASIFVLLFVFQLNAQVGIGTTSPEASSVLDITSSTKGVLFPRLTSTQRDAIVLPEKSLLIYNSTTNTYQYNSGTSGAINWKSITSQKKYPSVKFKNTNTSTNLNTSSAGKIPIFGFQNWNDDVATYTKTNAKNLKILISGRYNIICNISLKGENSTGSTEERTGVEAYVTVNGAQAGAFASSSYIRFLNGHNTSSLHINETLNLTAGDVISIKTKKGANSGTVKFRGNKKSTIIITKIK